MKIYLSALILLVIFLNLPLQNLKEAYGQSPGDIPADTLSNILLTLAQDVYPNMDT